MTDKRLNTLKLGGKRLNVENWKVFHPNGKHMFTCGENKANWYLERDLAIITDDDSIQLTFEPKGSGFSDDEIFGLKPRKIICVVSGVEYDLQRHHIIPYCYRTYLPDEYKSKNHHDVVLINAVKHIEYELIANRFKDFIADVYGVKTIGECNSEFTYTLLNMRKEYTIALSNLNSLFVGFDKIPNINKFKKLEIISQETNIPFETLINFNYIQLYKLYQELSNQCYIAKKTLKENKLEYDHGYQVVQKLDTHEKIKEFIILWRNHFIDTMKPQYMPEGWSIDFRVSNLR